MNDKILLFIPMYNCEKQITRVLSQINEKNGKYFREIIVINNRSTDNSEQAVIDYIKNNPSIPIKLLRNDDNYGLGGSHKVAFNYAIDNNFDYVIVLHGDDQGNINDFIPLIESSKYREYDCCLGSRFMRGSKIKGYSLIRILGNYGFNLLFSLCTGKNIADLGSGLNMYKVETLKNRYFIKYPDTLYFNDLMILASCFYKHKMLFYPISWREEDQVSNNKLVSFSISLLKMLFNYIFNRKSYFSKDLRMIERESYSAKIVNNSGE